LKLFISYYNASWLGLAWEVGCVSYLKSANESRTISCDCLLIFSSRKCRSNFINIVILKEGPMPVAARSTAWVCGRSLLGSPVHIPPVAWMSVSCECFVLLHGGFCDELLTIREETYRVWYVWVCLWSLDNEEAVAH